LFSGKLYWPLSIFC